MNTIKKFIGSLNLKKLPRQDHKPERSQSVPVIVIPKAANPLRSTEELLLELHKDENLHSYFQRFSKQEYSHENLQLYDEIYKFKTSSNKHSVANLICERYLSSNSKLQLYVQQNVIERIIEDCKQERLKDDLFSVLEEAVSENLLDILTRFKKSSYYFEYLNGGDLRIDTSESPQKLQRPPTTPRGLGPAKTLDLKRRRSSSMLGFVVPNTM
ncbi:hypothetical protein AKO1_007651 [Acrasis kona]|uniref:RGS domain-containing protein n=1 Tax=Acrasis kona TaxID=1008807 RepID=A0AAW2YQR1_9EUKA